MTRAFHSRSRSLNSLDGESKKSFIRNAQYRRWYARPSFQIFIEPSEGALERILRVLRIAQAVTFAGVDHYRSRHTLGLQRVPELLGLRRRAFDVALTDVLEGRRAYVLDVVDRRGARIHRRIVVHRRAEVGQHTGVDAVLAIVRLPVAQACSGNRRLEAVRLRHRPHAHEAAVAAARHAEPPLVNRRGVFRRVDAGEDIAQIAISKIADVGGGESLTLSEAAARVRIKNRPPSLDQGLSQTGPGECRM